MKKRSLLFIFVFLIGLLGGCNFNHKSNPESTSFCEEPMILPVRYTYFRMYVEIMEVEEDYYKHKFEYGQTVDDPVYETHRFVMVKCAVLEDFAGEFEKGTVLAIPFVLLKIDVGHLEDMKNFFKSMDKLLINCNILGDDYFEAIEEQNFAFVNENTGEYFYADKMVWKLNFLDKNVIGIKDGRLDLNAYDEITDGRYINDRKKYNHDKYVYNGLDEATLIEYFRKQYEFYFGYNDYCVL